MSRSWWRQARRLASAAALLLAFGASAQAQAPFNVKTYGANGTDSGDDTTAFLAAIAAVPATGGEVYIPAGRYLLSQTLSVSGKSIAFRGEGQGNSKLVWYAGVDGISFASALRPRRTAQDTLTVTSLSLLRSAGSGGAAITATWPVQGDDPATSPTVEVGMWHGNGGAVTTTIHDVHIGAEPWPNANVYWWFGIQLFNATVAKISVFNIQGPAHNGGVAAIQIDGTPVLPGYPAPVPDPNPNGKSIALYIRDGSINRYVRGVEVKNFSEGLHLNNVNVRESSWGLWYLNRSGGTIISNCYFQSRVRGILIEQGGGLTISHNTIHQFLDSDFMGIEVSNSFAQLIGNLVDSPAGGGQPRRGIVLIGTGTGTASGMLQGNTVHNMHTGVWLAAGSINAMVIGNIIRGGGIVNSGTGHYIADNW